MAMIVAHNYPQASISKDGHSLDHGSGIGGLMQAMVITMAVVHFHALATTL